MYIRKSLHAAQTSADIARDTLYLTQAADIHVLTIETSTPGTFKPETVFSVTFKNFGRTSAIGFKNSITIGPEGGDVVRRTIPHGDIAISIGPDQPINLAFPSVAEIVNTGAFKFVDIVSHFKRLKVSGSFSSQRHFWQTPCLHMRGRIRSSTEQLADTSKRATGRVTPACHAIPSVANLANAV